MSGNKISVQTDLSLFNEYGLIQLLIDGPEGLSETCHQKAKTN